MKKIIVLLALVAGLLGIAHAEWVNVFGSGDTRSITTFHDDGDVTFSTANRTARGWMILDDRGNMTTVNDYSIDRDESCSYPEPSRPACRNSSHERSGRHDAYKPFVPFE